MPFITEELYQRLPRKRLMHPSICVSPYPDSAEVIISRRKDNCNKGIKFVPDYANTNSLHLFSVPLEGHGDREERGLCTENR